ncbi:hypothetical protein Patl1_19406 [Pistacia atlantica]|uniref:Uncharacterized protein n=1 Tax=Pistacia atlantica TaxID=434234 RepID=A0ACC1BXY8_9ROSI|nr:hypothetical protein Patl1_19406 [Pistacia atlantica]
MEERLQNSAAEGDVEALFSILKEDPLVLERIDQIPFGTTPLHTAAAEGNFHFAKEMVNLKPSFARKRDQLGRSPLHLALEGRHQKLVTWFIKIDRELVHVKAKGLVTPLHYAAEIDDELNLADFLYVSPSSIKDLTVKCETAVHVALKNRSFRAFKVLLGWLRHFDKEEILSWKDEDGSNALHIATLTNQPEVVKLLIKHMAVNDKNGQRKTALDIFYDHRNSPEYAEVGKILLRAKAKRACQFHRNPDTTINRATSINSLLIIPKTTLVDHLSGDLSIVEKILKHMRLGDQILNKLPLEIRNVALVVAVLIVTATYQAALSPPGGYWQDDSHGQCGHPPANNTVISNTTTTNNIDQHCAGQMILGSPFHAFFFLFNSVAFSISVCNIIILISGLPFSRSIALSTTLIVFAYLSAMLATSPPDGYVEWIFFTCLMLASTLVAYSIPLLLRAQEWQFIQYGRWRKLHPGSFQQPKMHGRSYVGAWGTVASAS